MSHVIILARNTGEGNAYVREHRSDLPTGRHIVPTSASQITGVIPHLVIELPGFEKRPDRHALLAAVKRSTKKYLDCEWVVVGAPIHFISNGGMLHALPDTTGAQGVDTPEDVTCEICVQILETEGLPLTGPTERELTVAYRYNALRDAGIPEGVDPVIAMASVEVIPEDIVAEQEPAPKGRRRSKCKDCGQLHFPNESCDPFERE